MRIYFANRKFLTITDASEEYGSQCRYLNVHLEPKQLTMEALLAFLTPSALSSIIISTDAQQPLAQYENVFKSVHTIQRNIFIDGTADITIRLSSSDTGVEPLDNHTLTL